MNKQKFQLVEVLEEGEHVVSMINFRDQIYVATTRNIYTLSRGKLEIVELIWKKDQKDASPEV